MVQNSSSQCDPVALLFHGRPAAYPGPGILRPPLKMTMTRRMGMRNKPVPRYTLTYRFCSGSLQSVSMLQGEALHHGQAEAWY